MSSKLPYVNLPTSMAKILEKARNAQTPDRFTGDFLETKLGFRGGNYKQFIPLAKKLGLLGSDGRPTEIYKRFRNPSTSKAAMAQALRTGYKEMFERNEFVYELKKDQLKGLVVEITGLESSNRVVQLICQTFESLRQIADFEAPPAADREGGQSDEQQASKAGAEENGSNRRDIALGLSYTINLVLPKTDDLAVFSAIFRALRENLLRN